MPTLRLALAQVNTTVGDIPGNAAIVREWSRRALDAGAQIVAFPEMTLTGYPVEDLCFRESFVEASKAAVDRLATELPAELAVVVGYLDADGPARTGSDAAPDRGPRNALALLHGGRVVARYFKHHLPNYGVFDEDRYFVPGDTLTIVRLAAEDGDVDVALTICEDIWQAGGPFAVAGRAGAGLVININSSPYELNKDDTRLPLVARRAAEAKATVAYVNLVGGQDELVFDGDSVIVTAEGELLLRAGQFTEELVVADLDLPAAASDAAGDFGEMHVARVTGPALRPITGPAPETVIAPRISDEAEVWAALVTGLRDYVRKNGFQSVIVALSGGIDSTVVAGIAADALGGHNVHGIAMPSAYSSQHSLDDAEELAKLAGLNYQVIPISPMVDAFMANVSLSGLAAENLQARIRGMVSMSLSNQHGHLVLSTGNKSELAVGYATLYGDMAGAFNPLKDVPKTLVWRLAKWRNTVSYILPENSITKPPSAELRPDQFDSDSLPPYEQLDAIVAGYVDGDLGSAALKAAGHDPALVDRVVRMVDIAEYKRRQSCPGTKISIKAFGRDRRVPITNRFRETL
ncbi:NAD+ synthase [Longispora albida]|uniref:NAD+ synthase n=1 Tax=Longispora albida TaxID=203523 RepID=UPI00047786E5|nr:NAD+ synthase [Longispora albida]